MTEEEIRITEKYIKENRPRQYAAGYRLMRRLTNESVRWNVRVSYSQGYDVYVTDDYHARVSVRVEYDGTYIVTVCDGWQYHDITVDSEHAATQIVRLELEHKRFTMPNLFHK